LAEDHLGPGDRIEVFGILEWAPHPEHGSAPFGREHLVPWVVGTTRTPIIVRRLQLT
jgi:hypothetical protein